jgi:Fe-S-cluster-containing dehydrogenase component
MGKDKPTGAGEAMRDTVSMILRATCMGMNRCDAACAVLRARKEWQYRMLCKHRFRRAMLYLCVAAAGLAAYWWFR